MNKPIMIIHVQVFVWTYVFISLGHIPKRRIIRSYGKCMFNLLINCQTLSQVALSFYALISSMPGFQFLYILCFDCSRSNGCATVSHRDFQLHFPND